MCAQTTPASDHRATLDPRHFHRASRTGLTRDNLSEFAVNAQGRQYCINLIIGFLSNITHYLSSAQYGLETWQPRQVMNAADTIWSECITVGAERAAELARSLEDHTDAGHPREARQTFALLRSELIFVWEDLQVRLEALHLDVAKDSEALQRAS